jgi:lysyl-tRNA synthetase, class I
MEVMLASLRAERQQTYSIFLPIHPETGRVLYVPMKHVDGAKGGDHL